MIFVRSDLENVSKQASTPRYEEQANEENVDVDLGNVLGECAEDK